jgi:hypothetical protein
MYTFTNLSTTMRKSGVSHVEQKVIIIMNVHIFSNILIQEI